MIRDRRSAGKGSSESGSGQRILEGLGVSPGISIGTAHVRESGEISVPEYSVSTRQVKTERERLARAVQRSLSQIGKLKSKAEGYHGSAAEELGYLLDAHYQMLKSESLIGGIRKRIGKDKCNAEAAVMAEINAIAQRFAAIEDHYLRMRGQEVREVGHRILRNFNEGAYHGFSSLPKDSIIIAEEITPADTALMDPAQVRGFATVLGGAEGHTAIMARSLGLPAVLGIADLLDGVENGAFIIVDGSAGQVIVNPTAKCLADYEARIKELEREARGLARLRDVAAKTRDGVSIELQANLELPRELEQSLSVGAEGIGLLRTEFMFMNRDDLPSEEEQFQTLAQIVRAMDGRPVTIRTLDIGGEKLASSFGAHLGDSANPALGMRAIRLSLKERKILRAQLGAILRVGALGPVRILLPMISSVGEVLEVKQELRATERRLKRRGVKLAPQPMPLGIMIEVPGAALAADSLANVADFFAIGSNDLTMYTLAIDRSDERVAHLYNPLHPAVLRLIQFTIEAALRARIPISVCGEIAGDTRFTALLLGLGVRSLSMSAQALPRVKSRILSLDSQASTRRALLIMDQVDSGRISALLDDFNEVG